MESKKKESSQVVEMVEKSLLEAIMIWKIKRQGGKVCFLLFQASWSTAGDIFNNGIITG